MFVCAERQDVVPRQKDEVVFHENPNRWVLLPVEFPTLFKFYKALEGQYWTPSPLIWDKSRLVKSFVGSGNESPEDVAEIVRGVLLDLKLYKGFPSNSELDYRLYPDALDQICELTDFIQSPEARAFLGFQNMLEDFHREAINHAICALGEYMVEDSPALLDHRVCVQRVRHTLSKALWISNHTSNMTDRSRTHKLAGDLASYAPSNELNTPCLAEVLITMAVSKGLFALASLQIVEKWLTVKVPHLHETKEKDGDSCTDALVIFTSKFAKDMLLFSDFCSHVYQNLEHKLQATSLYEMVTEALVLEHQYIQSVFNALLSGRSPLLSQHAVDTLLKDLALRIITACGESVEKFVQYYGENELRVVEAVHEICWPQMEQKRGTPFDSPEVPYIVFAPLSGDWSSSPKEFTTFSVTDEGYYNPGAITSSDNRTSAVAANVPAGMISATTTAAASNTLQFDEDF